MNERHIEQMRGKKLPPNTPVVGIFGQIASGKDAAADILRSEFKFAHFTYSGVLENLLEAKGLQGPFTREKRWEMRRELVAEHGSGAHTRLLWQGVQEFNSQRLRPIRGVILNGPRPIEEARELKKLPNSTLIGIYCSREVRFQRLLVRQRPGDTFQQIDFDRLDSLESDEMKEMFESGVADIHITNEGTSSAFKKVLIDFVNEKYFLHKYK
jgi:dephospho-CoA kinase